MLRAPFALIWNFLKILLHGIKLFFFWLGHVLTRKKRKWIRIKLTPRQAFGPATGLAAYFQDKRSFLELREDIQILADDPRIEGVIVTADSLATGPARTADLRALIDQLRAGGKPIVFHTHSITGRDYELACAADHILMTPGGRLYLFGQRFDQYFAAPLLERLGVAAQFVHIGPFKAAAHRFIKDQGTPPLRLMMGQLLDSLSTIREETLLKSRSLSALSLEDTFSRMPLDDRQALVRNLIDARIQRPLVDRWIKEGADFQDTIPPRAADPAEESDQEKLRNDAPNIAVTTAEDYLSSHPGSFRWTPLFRRPPSIVTMDLSGMIVMPDMEIPGQSAATIDPQEVLPVLLSLARDRRVGAVVLHINSPGGSALASELLWDGIRRLRRQKPTIAYCSDVAASGGYYMAVAADRIICQPNSITGSIGVIAGKFAFPGALEKLGIANESFQRHETGLFESLAEPLSEKVLNNLRYDARSFYRQFLRRVGEARQLPRRRLHRYARGRVYSGVDAHRRHLVDHLGGFEDAVELARTMAELPESAQLKYRPHRKVNFPALLRKSAATTLLPEPINQLRFLHALAKQDPMLALMPFRLQDLET